MWQFLRSGCGYFFSGAKSSAQELMQYLFPPLSLGPSSKMCPKCPPQERQMTSVRRIPWLISLCSSTLPPAATSEKLGQPVPESNLASDENSGVLHAAQTYMPVSWFCRSAPLNGASVARSRMTRYCSGIKRVFQYASSRVASFSMC